MAEGDYIPLMVRKKDYNRLLKAFARGKGANLKKEMCLIEGGMMEGGAFNFGNFAKDLGRKIKNADYKKLSRQVANTALDGIRTTDKVSGAVKDMVIGQVSDAVNHGRGFMDIAKKVSNSNVGKALKKEAIKQTKKYAKEKLAERGFNGPLSNAVLDAGANMATEQMGAGFMDIAKKVSNSSVGKALKKEAIKQGKKYAKQKLSERGFDGPMSNALLDAGADYASQQVGGAFMLGGPKSLPKFLRKKAEASVLGVSQVPTDKSYGGRLVKGSQEARDRMSALRAMRKGGTYKF